MNNNVLKAIEQLSQGSMIILCDDDDRENEGDFVKAASFITPDCVNFMVTHGRGLVCQTISEVRAQELELEMQASNNTSLHETAFTISVDYIHGTSTGISTFDRAKTILAIENKNTKPSDLARPGHVFPIIADEGGLHVRQGHTEASLELVQLANAGNTAVICEILSVDGHAAKTPELETIAQKYNLVKVSIKEILEYLKK